MISGAQAAYLQALQKIETCRRRGRDGTGLDLSGLGLAEVPPQIGGLSALTQLDLSNNQLSSLPPEIGHLPALTELCLHHNQLQSLPPEMGQLLALTELNLQHNQLRDLPAEIGLLPALMELNVYCNRLQSLPPEIGQLSGLTELSLHGNQLSSLPPEIGQLTRLTGLSLAGNQLTCLPSSIGQLTVLTYLTLHDNELTSLPPSLGQLTRLSHLHLYNNRLTSLPSEVGQLIRLIKLTLHDNELGTLPPDIGQLTRLTDLDLSGNQLSSLPSQIGRLVWLTDLNLSHNRLSSLPSSIGKLTRLKRLFLHSNQLAELPFQISQLRNLTDLFLHGNPPLGIPGSILGPTHAEILGYTLKSYARPQDIINYYIEQKRALDAGTWRFVNEVKVMLVGRGGAGKTSLRRYFLDQPHDKGEVETSGIALDKFTLTCAHRRVVARLWDFAGQEITHALHQFFLTEGCVYILVLDPRSDTEMQDAEYWLGLLRRYAKESPVLLALNRQDSRDGGYDVDRARLKESFPNIHSFTPTNCENREGCHQLHLRLSDAVEKLVSDEPPHLRVPEAWLQVMRGCDEEQAEKYLSLKEFRRVCTQHHITNAHNQASLARFLHKLGAVLHFVDEPRLGDTAVLKPHWVTDGVYRLLRYKDLPESDGTLSLAEALKALPGESERGAKFFLRLMERFEMCFPMEEKEEEEDGVRELQPVKWLIPGALSKFQPESVTPADWQGADCVRLRYAYSQLPEGVLPRFIVMTHLLSEGCPRWRSGVVLQDGPARALVRRGQNRNHVEVTAHGPEAERLRLLQVVQGTLERIHMDLPEPMPSAEMELTGLPASVYRPVADLEAAEEKKLLVAVKTPGVNTEVDPTTQLNQRSDPESRSPGRMPLRAFLSYAPRDKNAKLIFQENLTVMGQKKLITHWHDGLIEPGTLWQKQIEDNLERMDLFIGLLTTAYLASEVIQSVDLKAARRRLRDQGRDFLFVLILMDEISLDKLDLGEYHIMRPGGKPVNKHSNRKQGFDMAQRELEALIQSKVKSEK